MRKAVSAIERIRARTHTRSPVALLVYLLTAVWIAFFAWSAVMRHAMFRSSALDLGYMAQAAWNTLHGRIMEFSTYQNAQIDLPLSQFSRTDHLLGYHVELLLIPLSLLFAHPQRSDYLAHIPGAGGGPGRAARVLAREAAAEQ